jgi:hypothetical protein
MNAAMQRHFSYCQNTCFTHYLSPRGSSSWPSELHMLLKTRCYDRHFVFQNPVFCAHLEKKILSFNGTVLSSGRLMGAGDGVGQVQMIAI